MIKLQVTKKFQDVSGLKAGNEADMERFYSWHVHTFPLGRKSGVIFMNDLTRYSVVLFGLKKADYKNLFDLFSKQLERNFKTDGYEKSKIENYLTRLDGFILTKTSNRSVMGSINDTLLVMPYWLDLSGSWDDDKTKYINSTINDTPVIPLKREGFKPFPNEAMREALDRYERNE